MNLQTMGNTNLLSLDAFAGLVKSQPHGEQMPILFVGHGNPMNAIEDNIFSRTWKELGKSLPRPSAILCISAHWQTKGTFVTMMSQPKTIHDFYGFPKALFDAQYPAAGATGQAELVMTHIKSTAVHPDYEWGLDHGTWSVLLPMFPLADIPVFQLSLDFTKDEEYHYNLAKELAFLRHHGVLIIGSGNIVHNLGMMKFHSQPYDWALEFDQKVAHLLVDQNINPLVHYHELGSAARLSIPTNEHYLPMLYALGASDSLKKLTFFNEQIDIASVSMRSFLIQ